MRINIENEYGCFPKVTVVIPAYNSEKYIEKCLDSLIHQTYDNLEIIIINDGSTDSTSYICNQYIMLDQRIRLLCTDHVGVSEARNFGIKNACGEYLAFVDADDYVDSAFISEMVNNLKNSSQLAIVDYYNVKNESISTGSTCSAICENMNNSDAINLLFDKHKFRGYVWNKLFDLNIIRKNKLQFNDKIKIWEDLLFCTEYLTKVETVSYLHKPLYYYVDHTNNTVNNYSVWREYSHLLAIKEMYLHSRSVKGIDPFHKQCLLMYLDIFLSKKMRSRVADVDIEMVNKLRDRVKKTKMKISLKMYFKLVIVYLKYYIFKI